MRSFVISLVGAAIGGLLGYLAFAWAWPQGFYALALPGLGIGLGASLGRSGSVRPALVWGVVALAAGILTEWRFFPFSKDESLAFFLTHLHALPPVTLVMIGVGAFAGFWFPFRTSPRAIPSSAGSTQL